MVDYQQLLLENNPWWETPEQIERDPLIQTYYSLPYQYHHPLLSTYPIAKDAVLTLRGPRRVGKSTLTRLIMQKLLTREKVNPISVFLFYCDRMKDYNELYTLIRSYLDFARPRFEGRLYLFLDEISFVSDWQRAVKELWDKGLLKNTTTLLTGSSILDIKYSSEWLSGRRGSIHPADREYLPLPFGEFVTLVQPESLPKNEYAAHRLLPKLRKLMTDYLMTGGFPLTINTYFKSNLLPNDLYDTFVTWIENDLHKTNKQEKTAYDIFSNLFRTLTTPISFTDLAKKSGLMSHDTAREYLEIFEKMFLTVQLPYFSLEQKRTDAKKNKKFYFTDPFIFHAIRNKTLALSQNNFNATQTFLKQSYAQIMENCVIDHLRRRYPKYYYGRFGQNKETDFVGYDRNEYHYFEVKYQPDIQPEEFAYFRKSFPKTQLTVISKNTLHQEKNLLILPVELFLLRGGK